MVETRTVKLPTGDTKTIHIIQRVKLEGNSWKPQNLADKLLGRFSHYKVKVEGTDSLDNPTLKLDYLPRVWVEKGTYS